MEQMLDRTNIRDRAYGRPSAPTEADIATLNPSIPQARAARPECRATLDSHKTFMDTNDTSGSGENTVPWNNGDGNTYPSSRRGAQGAYCVGEYGNGKGRPDVTVRFANRSYGIPLATILEKNSHSTLQSHGSLPSITCRYAHAEPSNTTSSAVHSHRGCRSLDEMALQRIQEHASHEQDPDDRIDDHASPNVGPPVPCPGSVSVPIRALAHRRQLSKGSDIHEVDNDNEGKGLKGLLRGVIQHVRGTPRRSEARSSIPDSSPPHTPGEPKDFMKSPSLHTATENENNESPASQSQAPEYSSSPIIECPELPSHEASEAWAADCKRSLSVTETSGRDLPSIWHVIPSCNTSSDELLPPSDFLHPVRTHSESFVHSGRTSLVSAVQDSIPSYYISGDSSGSQSHRSRDDRPDRYTVDGTAIYRSTAPSLYDHDRARDISLCSTASTSYSGPVVRIDLDLQQGNSNSPCRSSTPVWFGIPAPNQSQQKTERATPAPRHGPPHSITSSALPALLPIAAASGIVQPNQATRGVSFYSPSGNLIQADQNSRSHPSSREPKTTHYHTVLSFSSGPSARPRPTTLPLTTPPQSSMPLPPHISKPKQECHHQRINSQIIPETVTSSSSSKVKGCGGVMQRANSFTPRSGVRRSIVDPKSKQPHKPNHSSKRLSRFRFDAVASCTSRQTWRRKPQKGNLHPSDGRRKLGCHGERRTCCNTSGLGPLAGRAFRVCFCQPWDGAGDPPRRGAGPCPAMGDGCHDHAHVGADDEEVHVPARRVLQKRRRDSGVAILS